MKKLRAVFLGALGAFFFVFLVGAGGFVSTAALEALVALKAPLASPIFTGSVKFGTYVMSPAEYDAGDTSTALALNWSNGSAQKCRATGNVTFTFSNPVAGGTYILKILQDGTGARTYTWPAAVKWQSATAPTGSAANKYDVITLFYDGTYYFATASLNY